MKSLSRRRREYVFNDRSNFERVRREDIAGARAQLREIDPVIERVKDFRRLQKLDIELNSGAIFYGPRGTGKTHLTKYLATESGARFVDIRGFPRPKVQKRDAPLGADDIRELYRLAREYVVNKRRSIILFCDEFETVDKKGVTEELRLEMEGIKGRSNGIFFVLTSTADTPEFLDDGLFRSGRIGSHIPFTYPNYREKLDLLKHYLKKKPHDPDIDLESITYLLSPETSHADIKLFVNEAYDASRREERKRTPRLTQRALVERCLKSLVGFVIDEVLDREDKRIIAYHEAGHAVLAFYLGLPVQMATVFPTVDNTSYTHGKTVSIFPEGHLTTLCELNSRLVMDFGGVAAERVYGFPRDEGMGSDLCQMTDGAQELVEKFLGGRGVNAQFGPVVLRRPKNEYSDSLRKIAEKDIAAVLKRAEKKAYLLARRHKDAIGLVAEALLERKILIHNELKELIGNKA